MPRVSSALADPAPQRLDLLSGKFFARFRGRHFFVRILAAHPGDQSALLGRVRDNCWISRFRRFDRILTNIQAEFGFTLLFVRAMALVDRKSTRLNSSS